MLIPGAWDFSWGVYGFLPGEKAGRHPEKGMWFFLSLLPCRFAQWGKKIHLHSTAAHCDALYLLCNPRNCTGQSPQKNGCEICDFWVLVSFSLGKMGNKYIIIIWDTFSKYIHSIATRCENREGGWAWKSFGWTLWIPDDSSLRNTMHEEGMSQVWIVTMDGRWWINYLLCKRQTHKSEYYTQQQGIKR